MSTTQPQESRRWRVLFREYMELPDGRVYSRTHDPKDERKWDEVPPSRYTPPPSNDEPKKLYLVLENQAEGEPRHWFIFACQGESTDAKGWAWQVTGDATCMHYQHGDSIAAFSSDSYFTLFVLNLDLGKSQEEDIERAVNEEAPPSAEDRRSVRENCQGWVIRVLRRLVEKRVVGKGIVDSIERYSLEPIG